MSTLGGIDTSHPVPSRLLPNNANRGCDSPSDPDSLSNGLFPNVSFQARNGIKSSGGVRRVRIHFSVKGVTRFVEPWDKQCSLRILVYISGDSQQWGFLCPDVEPPCDFGLFGAFPQRGGWGGSITWQ